MWRPHCFLALAQVFTGEVPFSGGSYLMAMSAIIQRKRPPRPAHPNFTENLWVLMQRCWDHNPQSRPGAEQVLDVLRTPSAHSPSQRSCIFFTLACREYPVWKKLITPGHLAIQERISLITQIFSDHHQIAIVGHLSGEEAQIFINIVDEVSFCALKNA